MTTDIFWNQISNPEGNFLFAEIYWNEDGDIKRYIAKYNLSKSIVWSYNVIINGKRVWWLSSGFWYKMKRRNKNVNKKPRQRLYDRMFITLHGKPYFLFPDVLKRWSFPKNSAGIWPFLHYWKRWYFFVPKIWSYTWDGKWKVIFLKKMHGNMIFSSNFLKRWFFQKGPRGHMIFLVSSGKMVFFFPEYMIFFPWAESERRPFSGNTWKCDTFCIHVRVLQTWRHAPPSKKNQRWSYPAKIQLKLIDVPDWHTTKSSSNSLNFHGDLYRRFHALLSSEGKLET